MRLCRRAERLLDAAPLVEHLCADELADVSWTCPLAGGRLAGRARRSTRLWLLLVDLLLLSSLAAGTRLLAASIRASPQLAQERVARRAFCLQERVQYL